MDTIAAYIGLDWADERHSVHLQTADGTIEHVEREQKPAVLHEWVAQLQRRIAGGKIAVALEQRKGAVIHAFSSPRTQTGMSNGSTRTLAKPIAFNFLTAQSRALASASVPARRGPTSVVRPSTMS